MTKTAATTIIPDNQECLALFTAKQSMEIWVKTNGKMQLTRIATPAFIASRFNLIDPKSKKLAKTAKQCLKILDARLKAINAQIERNNAEAMLNPPAQQSLN